MLLSFAVKEKVLAKSTSKSKEPIVIVGTGPVGIRTLHELLKLNPSQSVVIYGDEPWEPYNRVRLSSFMAGQVSWQEMITTIKQPLDSDIVQHHNCAITGIDRQRRVVKDITGREQRFDKLILAIGSRPHIPLIRGVEKTGVYTFRSMNDVQSLMARRARTRKTVVLGGGLLGIEAARALQRANTEVVIVEHQQRLMAQHLDEHASALLCKHIQSLGIEVVLGNGVKNILGEHSVTGVQLSNDRFVSCDTVVLSTGIKPNIKLALESKIKIGRGIVVNDQLQTSDPNIFAVGECAEHRKKVYGLVGPGLEQSSVLAHFIHGKKVSYKGSTAAAKLKVIGYPVFSMGVVTEEDIPSIAQTFVYKDEANKVYRKIVVSRGRLIGVVATSAWPELGRVQEAITAKRHVWPWQRKRFERTGLIWPESTADDVSLWPSSATVCNCTGVTRGDLSTAITGGCKTFESLSACTGASTVCGSCKPLVSNMIGESVEPVESKGRAGLYAASAFALVGAFLTLFLSAIEYSQTVQVKWHLEHLWLDSLYKQISGFSLLALCVIALFISFRKRIKRFSLGDYGAWRVVHGVLGVAMLLLLFLHTGFSFGANLNYLLMSLFVGVALVGAVAGVVTAKESGSGKMLLGRWRRCATWTHIALFWPVPVILAFHITKTYYF